MRMNDKKILLDFVLGSIVLFLVCMSVGFNTDYVDVFYARHRTTNRPNRPNIQFIFLSLVA